MAEEVKATPEKTVAARGRPKTRIGVVTSNKMQKTVVVRVQRRVKHPMYGKYVLRAVKYKAHVEAHDYPKSPTIAEGDIVRIVETRPGSKDKRWRVVETVRKAAQA
ncbi:MAG TPA: 30S ribosomal protein S17 [Myxococcales bacterium]|jgi:small subunit ribosomal protein S17|nr:30S ribosomal protein S17 [Myxococcales bacterium]